MKLKILTPSHSTIRNTILIQFQSNAHEENDQPLPLHKLLEHNFSMAVTEYDPSPIGRCCPGGDTEHDQEKSWQKTESPQVNMHWSVGSHWELERQKVGAI